MIGYLVATVFALLAGIGWALWWGERQFTIGANENLQVERERYREQFQSLVDSMAKLVETLPRAMSPWLKAAEGGTRLQKRESAEGRHAYLASPEAKDKLKKMLKEQDPGLTDRDLDEAIGQVNAQVMGARVG